MRQLLNDLDSHELTEWMAFYQVENEKMKSNGNENSSGDVNEDIRKKMGYYGR